MAGITLAQRDLEAETRERLEAWFQHRFGDEAVVSELRVANRAAGWSSESLMFTAEVAGQTSEYVVRIPPAGGGIFREYDIGAQALTRNSCASRDRDAVPYSCTSRTARGSVPNSL